MALHGLMLPQMSLLRRPRSFLRLWSQRFNLGSVTTLLSTSTLHPVHAPISRYDGHELTSAPSCCLAARSQQSHAAKLLCNANVCGYVAPAPSPGSTLTSPV